MADSNPVAMGSRVRFRLASDDRLLEAIRRGETAAFEALYDRHAAELLSFCIYMLGSRHDAEDALQGSFASAYRALRADDRPVKLRPWMFTIARNECLSVLRKRRPTAELNGEMALTGDPVRRLELREEIERMLSDMRALPEHERAALVLAEVHGLSQREIGSVLRVRAEQVKAYIYQARSNLISEKRAREADCLEIRKELAIARGPALLRGRLRRHLRSCEVCRTYADGVSHQHRQLVMLFPAVPALGFKYGAFEQALGIVTSDPATVAGGAAVTMSAAGAAAGLADGGIKALAVKLAVGALAVGASAGVGVSVLEAHHPAGGERAFVAAHGRSATAGLSSRAANGSQGLSAPQGAHPRGSRFGANEAPAAATTPSRGGSAPTGASPNGPTPSTGAVTGPASRPGHSPAPRTGSGVTGPVHRERQAKGEPTAAATEREQAREERVREREEDRREREARRSEGGSSAKGEAHTPKGKEPHSEGETEGESVGVSRSPKTPEERRLQHEERQRRNEERQRQREEREQSPPG